MEIRVLRYFLEMAREGSVCFRLLTSTLETKLYIVLKKYQVFSPAAELLMKEMQREFGSSD